MHNEIIAIIAVSITIIQTIVFTVIDLIWKKKTEDLIYEVRVLDNRHETDQKIIAEYEKAYDAINVANKKLQEYIKGVEKENDDYFDKIEKLEGEVLEQTNLQREWRERAFQNKPEPTNAAYSKVR